MAHEQQRDFCLSVSQKHPTHFFGKRVLDCGSLDVNGNNRYLFIGCSYLGIDVGTGRNVDIVSPIHEFNHPDESFDTIISTECFEHDKYYIKSLKNIVRLLKSGGMFIFSCATTGRKEHGTSKTTPQDSPLTNNIDGWNDYYKNLEESDIRNAINIDEIFSKYEFSSQFITCDLYFWGIKK